jgi:hypothetical protein
MSSPSKNSEQDSIILDELQAMQKKIAAIKSNNVALEEEEEEGNFAFDGDNAIILEEVVMDELPEGDGDDDDSNDQDEIIEEIVVDGAYILNAEQKINEKINRIENKIDEILSILRQGGNSKYYRATHFPLPSKDSETAEPPESEDNAFEVERMDEMFPIKDVTTFEWFMRRLARPSTRKIMVEQQANVVKTVNFKSIAIAVKQFINAHVEMKITIQYSVSGYGHHGKLKRKVNSADWSAYILEAFKYNNINDYGLKQINKAVVQHYGRAPDVYGRAANYNRRPIRRPGYEFE